MLRFIARRILIAIPTIVIVSILVFTLQQLLPGDPVLTMAGEERDPEVLAFLRDKYRLDDPIPIQYFAWIVQVLQGNLGISLRTDIPVLTLILGKLPVTLELAIFAMIIALAIGIPAGILSAVKKGTSVDYAANVVALSGPLHPEFLARHPAHHAGFRALATPARLRLRAAERRSVAQHQDDDHAGIRARHRPRRKPHAPHPQRDARRLAVPITSAPRAPRDWCRASSS